jgi:hypothetical protein
MLTLHQVHDISIAHAQCPSNPVRRLIAGNHPTGCSSMRPDAAASEAQRLAVRN